MKHMGNRDILEKTLIQIVDLMDQLNIKQIFDKKNRISKIIQSRFDDIRRSEAESNIIKARLNNFRYPIFRVEYLFYRLPKLRNR